MTDDPATGRGDQDNWRSRLREFGATWQVMLAEAAGKIPGIWRIPRKRTAQLWSALCPRLPGVGRAKTLGADERLALMQDIMHEKRGELLGRLSGEDPWSDAALKALGKLNSIRCKRSDYMRLGGYMRLPTTARVLSFAPYLSPRILQALWELPDWICLPNLPPVCAKQSL